MTTMDGVRTRAPSVPLVCCVLLTSVTLLCGCARVVNGTARPGDPQSRLARPVPVTDLLIEPTRFPPQYPAAVLPPKDVDRALSDVDGIPAGSEVTPSECAPLPVLAPQRAAVQGTDEATGSRLTVTVVRPMPSVRARVAQLAECRSFTSTTGEGGEVSEVTVDLPPAPPVDADDSYAVDQTTRSASSDVPDIRTLTLVALIGDVRVTASMQDALSDPSPTAQALDTLFTAAVLKVRKLIPR